MLACVHDLDWEIALNNGKKGFPDKLPTASECKKKNKKQKQNPEDDE